METEQTNVICLQEAMDRYRAAKCRHRNIVVDEALAEVECATCGAKLNPVQVLVRMAREESRWWSNYTAMKEMKEKLELKQRCKCMHCGQMTRVRP